jgi:hypothetical protein
VELHQRHAGDGAHIVGIHHVQERLDDLREVVVDAEVHPGGQEGKPLQEPLHVGILALRGLQLEAPRHLRVAGGELRSGAPEKGQLPLVVGQEVVTHGHLPR